MPFKIACQCKGASSGTPAIARLDTYSASVAEGPGENMPAILGLKGMANMRAALILEQGHEKIVIPGTDMHRLSLGKGARALDLIKAPSGHLAIKVDECGVTAEAVGSTGSSRRPRARSRLRGNLLLAARVTCS
eukprot:6383180-Pyramimonas_sp.AAC.1